MIAVYNARVGYCGRGDVYQIDYPCYRFCLNCKMLKVYVFLLLLAATSPLSAIAQDSTSSVSEETLEVFDVSQLSDAADAKVFCTQKTINQTPTRIVSLGYEYNGRFTNNNVDAIDYMAGLRAGVQVLALSTNKAILSIGANYWGTKMSTSALSTGKGVNQLYSNRMDMLGLNALLFKPLDKKHFIIVQANTDASNVGGSNNFAFDANGITVYGSAMYGWKKNDYQMTAIGISRTYRLGRPLFVPIFLFNKTFNQHWGLEMLLPARAHVRYNFSATNILLAGVELEGQQYYLERLNVFQGDWFLQRGEVKPRLAWEKKLYGFIWLGAQAGYRLGYRYNVVDKYNGKAVDEITTNSWGNAPYFNVSLNFVTP
jgi:hypothetical protein